MRTSNNCNNFKSCSSDMHQTHRSEALAASTGIQYAPRRQAATLCANPNPYSINVIVTSSSEMVVLYLLCGAGPGARDQRWAFVFSTPLADGEVSGRLETYCGLLRSALLKRGSSVRVDRCLRPSSPNTESAKRRESDLCFA